LADPHPVRSGYAVLARCELPKGLEFVSSLEIHRWSAEFVVRRAGSNRDRSQNRLLQTSKRLIATNNPEKLGAVPPLEAVLQ
jgi:hypothetical protein